MSDFNSYHVDKFYARIHGNSTWQEYFSRDIFELARSHGFMRWDELKELMAYDKFVFSENQCWKEIGIPEYIILWTTKYKKIELPEWLYGKDVTIDIGGENATYLRQSGFPYTEGWSDRRIICEYIADYIINPLLKQYGGGFRWQPDFSPGKRQISLTKEVKDGYFYIRVNSGSIRVDFEAITNMLVEGKGWVAGEILKALKSYIHDEKDRKLLSRLRLAAKTDDPFKFFTQVARETFRDVSYIPY